MWCIDNMKGLLTTSGVSYWQHQWFPTDSINGFLLTSSVVSYWRCQWPVYNLSGLLGRDGKRQHILSHFLHINHQIELVFLDCVRDELYGDLLFTLGLKSPSAGDNLKLLWGSCPWGGGSSVCGTVVQVICTADARGGSIPWDTQVELHGNQRSVLKLTGLCVHET